MKFTLFFVILGLSAQDLFAAEHKRRNLKGMKGPKKPMPPKAKKGEVPVTTAAVTTAAVTTEAVTPEPETTIADAPVRGLAVIPADGERALKPLPVQEP